MKRKPKPVPIPPLPGYIITRTPARGGASWHIQCRTEDQMSSWVLVVGDDAVLNRSRGLPQSGTGIRDDIFCLVYGYPPGTMNVIGQIKFTGKWPKGF